MDFGRKLEAWLTNIFKKKTSFLDILISFFFLGSVKQQQKTSEIKLPLEN